MSAAGQEEPRWLDDKEMRTWRAYIIGSQMLAYQLHRELQDGHGVALADYEILVRLSEQPHHQMRMSQLAGDVASSKSRVSHQVARLEAAGLVRRTECPQDGRGVFAQLTDHGMRQLEQAAPTHVEGVRAHLIDLLDDNERLVIADAFEKVIAHLRGDED